MDILYAQTPAAGGSPMDLLTSVLPFVLIIGIFYFMMIRPQQKKQKEMQAMINDLKKGDKVVLSGGIHGTVSDVEEKTLLVNVADNTRIRVEKVAVASVAAKN